jgi:hypothetical protein
MAQSGAAKTQGRVQRRLTQGRVDQKAKAAKTVQETRVLKLEGLQPEGHALSHRYALMGQYKEEYGQLGVFSLCVNERRVWKMTGEDYLYLFYAQRETEEDKRWHWWIGDKKSMEKGEGNGIARVASTAYTPNKITGVWQVTNQVTGSWWHAAPEMKVTVYTPAKQKDVQKGSAKGGLSAGGTLSEAAQTHLGKYEKRMQEETASAESARKGEDDIEDAVIAHVNPILREEMRRDSLTDETAEELIKRLAEDYQCESESESESDEEDAEADESEGGDGEGGGGSDGGGDEPQRRDDNDIRRILCFGLLHLKKLRNDAHAIPFELRQELIAVRCICIDLKLCAGFDTLLFSYRR